MSLGYIFLFVLFLPRGKGLERELGKGQSECAYITSATHTKTTHTHKKQCFSTANRFNQESTLLTKHTFQHHRDQTRSSLNSTLLSTTVTIKSAHTDTHTHRHELCVERKQEEQMLRQFTFKMGKEK